MLQPCLPALLLLLLLAISHDPPIADAAKAATSTRRSAAPTPTPTVSIPPGCASCWYPNNTTHTCFHNTQCVPLAALCNPLNPCPAPSDPSDSVDCLDQICSHKDSLPLPKPTPANDVPRSSKSCREGNFPSLSQTSAPKYVFSCILEEAKGPFSGINCSDWEYAFQGSCYLRTCGGPTAAGATTLDCLTDYECKKQKASDEYGLCVGSGDTNPYSSGGGDDDNGSAGQYSSQDYLLQGLLIGICSLVLGVGMGVGFWHYRMKRKRGAGDDLQHGHRRRRSGSGQSVASRRQNSMNSNGGHQEQEQGQGHGQDQPGEPGVNARHLSPSVGPPSSTRKSRSWLSTVFSCGKRRPGTAVTRDRGEQRSNHRRTGTPPSRDSFDTESQEDDDDDEEDGDDPSHGRRSSNIFVTGRWRWGAGASSSQMLTQGMPGLAIVPEMDPPPMYQNEPGLPTYNPDDIGMTRIHAQEGASNARPAQPLENTGHERIPEHPVGASNVVISANDHINTTSTATPPTVARTTPSTNILPEETLPIMPSLQPLPTNSDTNDNNNRTILSEPDAAHLSRKDK